MYKRLVKGSDSYDVIALQQLLNMTNIVRIPTDGIFGQITEEALKEVQSKIGVKPTGATDLLTYQALYKATNVNQLGLKNFVFGGMREDQYMTEYQKKDIIVLHHNAKGPNPYYQRDQWHKNKDKVGTAYIIGGKGEYDGVALQVFQHPSQWAYHLSIWSNFLVYGGLKQKNKDHEISMAKRTIGVEVCNYGYLELKDTGFYFMKRGIKNKLVPDEDVIDYGARGYRGKRYYHRYTTKQIDAIHDFITKAAKYYSIRIDKPKGGFDEKWFDYSWEATRGDLNLISHSSVRSRSDMHPQPELIDMLNSL